MKKQLSQWNQPSLRNRDDFGGRDFWETSDRMNRLIDSLFGLSGRSLFPRDMMGMEQLNQLPVADVDETSSHFLVSLEMPGVARKDVDIDIDGDQLVIRAERHFRTGNEGRGVQRFMRSFTLPSSVDAQKIEANLRDGVLELAIPKSESSHSRRIDIGENKEGFFSRFLNKVEEAVKGEKASAGNVDVNQKSRERAA